MDHFTEYEPIVKAVRDKNADWREVNGNNLHERLTLELSAPKVTISIERHVSGEQDWGLDRYFDVQGEVYEVTDFAYFDEEDNDIPSDFNPARLCGILNWGKGVKKSA
jgi:hypothetical protein